MTGRLEPPMHGNAKVESVTSTHELEYGQARVDYRAWYALER